MRGKMPGMIYFLGAGCGDPDYLPVKALRVLKEAGLVVYAGSLLTQGFRRVLSPQATLLDSHGKHLEEIIEAMVRSAERGETVARLHSGDTAFFSALNEEIALLKARGIPFEVIPGVSSASLGAARMGIELTVPERVQTVVFTRLGGRTPGPGPEDLAHFARPDVTLVLFLSVSQAETIQNTLLTRLPPETPVAVAEKLGFPEERILYGTLKDLSRLIREAGIRRTALIYVGEAVGCARKPQETRSRLYSES